MNPTTQTRADVGAPPAGQIIEQQEAPSPQPTPDPVRSFATFTFLRGSVIALGIALLAGMLAVVHYIPGGAQWLNGLGISFTALRPLHTTFASAWIFLGGIAVVHRYLQDHAGPATSGDRWRLRIQVVLWALAGTLILGTLLAGIGSGREYMGFHPLISIPILLGWICFGWNFLRVTWRGFWRRPVYVTMWGTGIFFFMFTFIEQHAWLLPGVFEAPVVDLRVQWKACGTLVGSFNLFVYGSLYYLGEKLSGDERYAHSRLAYMLFGVGLLNSFTNFAHHTYHLPQNNVIKWIAFVVSMAEIIILARVVWDLVGTLKRKVDAPFSATKSFMTASKWWVAAMLVTAILISIPPLNAVIHGTHVVAAHAMGTEIGIDSMVLFATLSWLLMSSVHGARGEGRLHSAGTRRAILGLNVGVAALVIWLHISGITVGINRYNDLPTPAWLQTANPYAFASAGFVTSIFLIYLLGVWIPHLFRRAR